MTGQSPEKSNRTLEFNTLAAAALPLVAAGVQLWLFAGGDAPVFLVLLNNMSLPTLLIGTTVVLAPVVVGLTLLLCITDWKVREWITSKAAGNAVITTAMLLFLLVVAITIPWFMLVVVVGGFVGLILADSLTKRFWRWGHRNIVGMVISRRSDGSRPNSGVTAVMIGILIVMVPIVPWLATEEIQFTTGHRTTGYVVASNSEWTTVMTIAKAIEIEPTPAVESRTVCNQGRHESIANILTRLLSSRVELPNCDT